MEVSLRVKVRLNAMGIDLLEMEMMCVDMSYEIEITFPIVIVHR